MRCGQCVNCVNPQRKRPCVLARRKLLDLLRQQEEATAAARGESIAGEGAAATAEGVAAQGVSEAPVAARVSGGEGSAGGGASAAASVGVAPLHLLSPATAVAALHYPGRKHLFPIIPPTERCGKCKPCLNPKLKKACHEARQRQLEQGLVSPLYAAQVLAPGGLAAAAASGNPGAAAALGLHGSVGGGRRVTATATAAAIAAGQALGASLIGCRVRIYWAGMRRWYEGRISNYTPHDGCAALRASEGGL